MVSGQRLFQSHLNRRGSRHLQQILLHQQIRLQYRRNGKDFIGTEQALDVWYALLHDLDYQILSKVLQQYMLTNKFKPTVAELREIYTELVSPTISDWSEGWEKVSKAIGHYGMYQEEAAMESFDEVTREVVKRLGFLNICLSENIVADRARFAEIYQAIHRRKRTEVNVGSAFE